MKNLTKKQLTDYELTHDHAGNRWAMVEDIDHDYCRIAMVGGDVYDRAFLAWKKKLSVSVRRETNEPDSPIVPIPIKESDMIAINKVRDDIKNGLLAVRQTRICKA